MNPKSARDGMASDNLNEIFERAVSRSHNAYELLDINIIDADKLKDTCNLEITIKSTHSNHVKYDMHNVFTVFNLHQYPNELKTVNLYTDYTSLTIEEVSQRNVWYETTTEDPHQK